MTELVKSPVVFNEEDHTYFLGDKQLNGVTSTLIRRAFPNKYDNVDPEVLAKAAQKGHELHALIEYHDTFGTSGDEHEDHRVMSYERLKKENGLTTIANEYLVSDEENYASCIDIVAENTNSEICLVDIKTTWTLDRESTALQLSIYKRLFERQNPGRKVAWLFALWLPNKDHSLAEMPCLRPVSDTIIDGLIAADLADQPFDITAIYGTLPALINDVQDEVIRIETEMKEMKERSEALRKGLYEQMMLHDCKSFESPKLLLTRVLPSETETFDSKRFKEEHPDLYKEYVKKSKRAGSLKITIRDK